jgi:hypothetical protein
MADTQEAPLDDRGRRCYQLRPHNPRRTDFMGFNSTWWMVLAWIILILVILFPWW